MDQKLKKVWAELAHNGEDINFRKFYAHNRCRKRKANFESSESKKVKLGASFGTKGPKINRFFWSGQTCEQNGLSDRMDPSFV